MKVAKVFLLARVAHLTVFNENPSRDRHLRSIIFNWQFEEWNKLSVLERDLFRGHCVDVFVSSRVLSFFMSCSVSNLADESTALRERVVIRKDRAGRLV